jgi:hypothetical protein
MNLGSILHDFGRGCNGYFHFSLTVIESFSF